MDIVDISEWLLDRASTDDTLTEKAQYLILAALESDDAVDVELDGLHRGTQAEPELAHAQSPVKSFLTRIEVEGFRGIGDTLTLRLHGGPGLTVIAGRNGSGKSSLVEGLDLALRQKTSRACKKNALWRDQWRNLHHAYPARIRIGLVAEDVGETDIGVDWGREATDWQDMTCFTQVKGKQRTPGLSALGWERAMELYRPLLSYDELGGLLEDDPSALYDAIESILGLEQLTQARRRLDARLKEAGRPGRDVAEAKRAALALLPGIDDDRAGTATELLNRRNRLQAATEVSQLLAGAGTTADPTVRVLADLADLAVPGAETVAGAATCVAAATWEVERRRAEMADAQGAAGELLHQALLYHDAHGEGPCPICGGGMLDADWAARTRTTLSHNAELQQRLDSACHDLDSASTAWSRLAVSPPATLAREDLGLTGLAPARDAWLTWDACASRDNPGPDAVSAHAALVKTLADLRAEAGSELARRQDAWAPAVSALAVWVDAVQREEEVRTQKEVLTQAVNWLKTHGQDLRRQRLEPLGDQARAIWASLRTDSNVDLEGIRLEGEKTRRRVQLDGRVDDRETGALAVMSQGELHALALALFIPRATMPESPFRFLVIDDPIQAMDPSKIDGLIAVLDELARHRQVVVLSHDDRLPSALRRSTTPARIYEIVRDADSRVAVMDAVAPVERYVEDAFAVAKDDALDDVDRRRILPGLFRLAIEYASHEAYVARRLRQATPWSEIDRPWDGFSTPDRVRAALGLLDDQASFDRWLNREDRRVVLGISTSGFHRGLAGDPVLKVNALRRFLASLERGS